MTPQQDGDAAPRRRRARPRRPGAAGRRPRPSGTSAAGSSGPRRCRSARRCPCIGAAAVPGSSPPSSTWRPASRVGATASSSGSMLPMRSRWVTGTSYRDGEQRGVAVLGDPRRGDGERRASMPASRSLSPVRVPGRGRRPARRGRRPGRWRCRRRAGARAAGRCPAGRGRRGRPSSPGRARRAADGEREAPRQPTTQRAIVRHGWAAENGRAVEDAVHGSAPLQGFGLGRTSRGALARHLQPTYHPVRTGGAGPG